MVDRLANVYLIGMRRTLTHFRKIVANLPKMTTDMMKEFGDDLVRTAKRNVEERATYKNRITTLNRGVLKDSINVLSVDQSLGDTRVKVGVEPSSPAVKYAYYFEEGVTGGQKIKPKGNYPLAFFWADGPQGAGYYWSWSVTRGSFKGRHFMRDAVIEVSDRMRTKLEERSKNIIKE